MHMHAYDILRSGLAAALILFADLQISKVQQVQQKIWRGTIIG